MARTAAVLALALALAAAAGAARTSAPKPRVVWRPIPFPAARLKETADYSRRHYGAAEWRLRNPRVIVEHYTGNTSATSTWRAFASDAPDAELHEQPGTCAHFVVDVDGTIYQLVRLGVRCRHTVGLNWTAIGIENVGTSARAILVNRAQSRASLALTAWLMGRYRIDLGDVIGHAESLTSPYHRERYAAWRCQTHGDFTRADMDAYRARLAALARREGVPLGRRVHRVRSAC